jgi:hypothetical protein
LLLKGKKELVLVHLGNRNKGALVTIVTESVGEKLCKTLPGKAEDQHSASRRRAERSSDCRAFAGEITVDFLAQIFHEIRSRIRDQVGLTTLTALESDCKVEVNPEIISRKRLISLLSSSSRSSSLI